MRNPFSFTVGKHVKQAHEYTDVLVEEAYRRKDEGNPTSSDERVTKSDALCESCFDQVGVYPPPNVLTRLAWYIVFDEMTDMHPDKMTREEYPIMSEPQRRRRFNEIPSKNVYFNGKDFVGIVKTCEKKDTDDTGRINKRPIYSTLSDEEKEAKDTEIDVMKIIDKAELTERQKEAIELVYFEGLTQSEAAKRMGISQPNVSSYIDYSLKKMKSVVL